VAKKCPRCRKSYDEGVQFCPDDGAGLTSGALLDPAVTTALASDYRILDCLGSGGMGTVFLAEQIRVGNRKVALKVLHRKFSEDDEFISRFENEAASTGRINHPNVITIYESKQASDGTLYIAMELVEGDSLTEHLRRRGRLPLDEAVQIAGQCCKALQAAHRLGIIHRDIKPDNIMLSKDFDGGLLVKILDFGIAKLKDSSGHTVTGSVLGTPAYMSYEQASGMSSDKLDGRSDIYSLGIVAYTMLVGHPPFRADTPVGYITKHLTEAPPPLRGQRPDVPAAVEMAVLKALEKDRERRHQTAGELAAALREAAKAPVPITTPTPAIETTPTPAPPWRARPSAAQQTTQVGLTAAPAAAAPPAAPPAAPSAPTAPGRQATTPPPGSVVPPRTPSRDVPTLPPGTAAPPRAPSRDVPTLPPGTAAPTPREAPPSQPTPTGPRVVVPPPPPPSAPPAPPRRPGTSPGERITGPVPTPPGPIHRPAPPVTRPPVERAPVERPAPARPVARPAAASAGSGEGPAMAYWGIRKLVSWGMLAASFMFLLVAVWPMVGGYAPAGFGLVLFYLSQPVTQTLTDLFGPIRIWGWDPVPLVLTVALLILRPYLTAPLWRLEMQARQRAAAQALAE